jgi:FtsH-binding integral membrane protein
MKDIIKVIPVIFYFIVGIISLIMAVKSLLSKKFISFHEQAAGKPLDNLDKPLQLVILTIMKVSGLGFFVVAILLIVFPIVNYFRRDEFIKYAIPLISIIYCTGLFLVNYYLYKETKASTPWKKSLFVIIILLAGLIISFIV